MRFASFLAVALAVSGHAESGYDAWLRYAPLDGDVIRAQYASLPAVIVMATRSPVLVTSQDELTRGIKGLLGRTLRSESTLPEESAIVLGTVGDVARKVPGFRAPKDLRPDGYCIQTVKVGQQYDLVIAALNDRGVLYGAFDLLRRIALHEPVLGVDLVENPAAPIRMVDEWDNLNGTIERGYGGDSIFWDNGHIAKDLGRVRDYARLLGSIGIESCCILNVNADPRVLSPGYLPELVRVAEALRPWGVRLFISLDFSSPQRIGGLDTFDPLDPKVIEFWKQKVDEIYRSIPDFGGFVLKADSEGRVGPSTYGRTHADAANVIARPLASHGGILFYRGFVYDHHMDWRNLKNDRARAAYDNFHGLDGKFDSNVVIQIKYGPIDFQVREPVSPLFGALERTSQAIELEVTQEYTGQQRHLCFLVPMWKEILDFDLQARGAGTPVKALVSGKMFDRSLGGFVAVVNVGRDTNWLGSHLAMANLYGFGRLAWDPDLSSAIIAQEWTGLTFGSDRRLVTTMTNLLLTSWKAYEDYTGFLGVGGLTDILGVHYGPGIESSERNGWGQWHRADAQGIGMDRTVATGTGYTAQYRPPVAQTFESLETCPDELLLFFHHVPYTYHLHSGKTLIQHVYDSHYAGAEEAAGFVQQWKTLQGLVDDRRYQEVLDRLEYQAGHAIVWRDAVCQWFLKTSGIPDQLGRAGHYPNRIEAENMKLEGYQVVDVKPWETASGGRAVECVSSNRIGSAGFQYAGEPGRFDLAVQYFDQNNGMSRFELWVNGRKVDQWAADRQLPGNRPNGHTSTRYTARGITLKRGDEIQIRSKADGGENACLDYVEILPS